MRVTLQWLSTLASVALFAHEGCDKLYVGSAMGSALIPSPIDLLISYNIERGRVRQMRRNFIRSGPTHTQITTAPLSCKGACRCLCRTLPTLDMLISSMCFLSVINTCACFACASCFYSLTSSLLFCAGRENTCHLDSLPPSF
uniref:Uncharacterized protein n=1 Tax=Schistocephalus solidus TaxID=70667 RepID=A0A0X3PGM7_SCHSO